jgi:hypothetical protein
MEKIFGKSFDYAKEIPDLDNVIYPHKVSDKGSFDQLEYNIDALSKYADITLKGPPMGINYFLYTGKCSGEPDNGKSMYTYIRNVPTGKTILGSRELKGIVPGVLEDMADLNPIELIKSIFTSPKKKSLSDYDKKTKSNCKKIKRLEKLCRYKGCKNKCKTKRVSKSYDECKDIDKELPRWSKKYSVFCTKKARNKAKKRCEGFINYRNMIEHYKNLKDTNYLTNIIITIMILLFTYLVLNR